MSARMNLSLKRSAPCGAGRGQAPSIALKRARLAQVAERAAAAHVTGHTVLEMSAVQEPTLKDYRRRLGRFHTWLATQGAPALSVANVDDWLALYMEQMFLEGYHVGEASKLVAALQHFWPQIREHTPRAWRSIKGWAKLAPPRTRAPLPWLALMAMIGLTLHRGLMDYAVGMLVQFVCYLRPGELLALHPQCFAPPAPLGPGRMSSWGLILRPLELGRAAKSGEFDESVLIDRPDLPFLNVFLGMLKRRRQGQPVWTFTQNEYAAHITSTAKELHLGSLQVDSYTLRHGGASADRLTDRRSLAEVKRRGRWRSDTSLRRYEKSTIVLRQVALMSAEIVKYAQRIELNLGRYMLGETTCPAPPKAMQE